MELLPGPLTRAHRDSFRIIIFVQHRVNFVLRVWQEVPQHFDPVCLTMCQWRFVAGCEKLVFALSEILHLADPVFTLDVTHFQPYHSIQWLIGLLDRVFNPFSNRSKGRDAPNCLGTRREEANSQLLVFKEPPLTVTIFSRNFYFALTFSQTFFFIPTPWGSRFYRAPPFIT
jgi:hypothetical protein